MTRLRGSEMEVFMGKKHLHMGDFPASHVSVPDWTLFSRLAGDIQLSFHLVLVVSQPYSPRSLLTCWYAELKLDILWHGSFEDPRCHFLHRMVGVNPPINLPFYGKNGPFEVWNHSFTSGTVILKHVSVAAKPAISSELGIKPGPHPILM